MIVQSNNNFIPAQTWPGLTRSEPLAAIWCVEVCEEWATETKQRPHWSSQDNKEVMTCYIVSNPSEGGRCRRMYGMYITYIQLM